MFGKLGSLLSFLGHDIRSEGAVPKAQRAKRAPRIVQQTEQLELRTLMSIDPIGPQQAPPVLETPEPIFVEPGQPVPVSPGALVGTYDADYAALAAQLASQLTTTGTSDPEWYTESIEATSDVVIQPQLAQSGNLVRRPQYAADPRYATDTGAGYSIVVLDTGIDLDHPFFGPDANNDGVADRIVFSYDFSGINDSDASDFDGHGSNVTSIVASSDSTFTGMAPGASIIHLKVFPDNASLGASTQDIEEALQWVVANAATYNIVSVNMSLGGGNFQLPDNTTAWADEFAALSVLRVIPVAAAGNSFFSFGSAVGVGLPAADPNVIAVSAVWDGNNGSVAWADGAIDITTAADRITSFSQRDPLLTDVLAPGAFITGAGLNGTTLTEGGTSQASPHVAGAAALAQSLAMHYLGRRLTLAEFRTLMKTTGPLINDGDDEDDNVTNTGFSWHRLDLVSMANAIFAQATPPTLTFVPDITTTGVTIIEDSSTGPLSFVVGDAQALPGSLIVTATSSNPLLVPDKNLVLGGTGANRTITVAPLPDRSGTAVITVNVSNGRQITTKTFTLTVQPQPDPVPQPPGLVPVTTPFPNLTPVPMADAGITTSTIDVQNLANYLFDANVTINITHPASGELTVRLISPNGTSVTLTSGNGGTNADVFAGTLFDDQAERPISDIVTANQVVVPFTTPEGALAQLLGENPNGTWTLEVTDSLAGNVGTLNSWSLDLTTLPAPPPLLSNTFNSTGLPVTIPDTGVALDRTITVNNLDRFLWDANLTINVTHPRPSDLQIYLISPKGNSVTISTGNGGSNVNVFNGTTFDDQGIATATDVVYASGVVNTLLIPEAALAQLLGEDPNGTWTLRIIDNTTGSVGNLVSWSLDLTTVYENDPPTLGTIVSPNTIYEDSGLQTVALQGITAGPGETQTLIVSATSDNPGLIPNPTVSYTSPNAFAQLTYTPVANQSGFANITVTVLDAEGASVSRKFTVIVLPVNDSPTLDPIVATNTILEDALEQNVSLTGITAGPSENQVLSIQAVSSNPSLVPNPTIDYVPGSNSAILHYTPVPDANGVVTFTVTVTDAGLDGNLQTTVDNLSVTRTFTVTVTSVNDAPTIDVIANPAAILEDSPSQTVGFSGVTAGGNESQPLRVTATSSNLALLPEVFVSYTPGASGGALTYRPAHDAFGTGTITVTVQDAGPDGIFDNGDDASTTRTFTVTITPVNDPPVFDFASLPGILNEDAGLQTLNLVGIAAGVSENQEMQFSVSSTNPALVSNASINYTSPGTTGTLTYSPNPNAFGSTFLTITLTDGGLDNNLLTTADNAVFSRQIVVVVLPVNDNPTLNVIADPAPVAEDSTAQSITLTGITAGGGESQPIEIVALSSNTGLIPHPTVTYTSPNNTATLTFTPNPDLSGTALISVIVRDGGLDGDLSTTGDNGSISRTFTITISPVNDPPSFADFATNPVTVLEDFSQQEVVLSSVTAGTNETQNLQFTAVSDNPTLISSAVVGYTTGSTSASLFFTANSNQFGTAHITVTVTDPGLDNNFATTGDNLSFSRILTVNVIAVNDLPTLDVLSNLNISEDASQQTVNLSGITAGPGETQPLSISATSSNIGLIPNPLVTYTSANATGQLRFTPFANQSGVAVITVTVTDGGLDGNLATTADNGSFQRTFTVTVNPVNDLPTLNPIADPAPVNEDSDQQTVNLLGISAGGGESQPITVDFTNSNPGLFSEIGIDYTAPGTTGVLHYTPAPNASGVATITIIVTDSGLDNNLATTGDNGVREVTFNVVVSPVNDAPTLSPIANVGPLNEDFAPLVIGLSGITAGGGESQPLAVTATSSNPALIPNPGIAYSQGVTIALLTLTGAPNQSGTATITVQVVDGGLDGNLATTGDNGVVTQTFTVTVNPVNDTPTIDPIASTLEIAEDSPTQTLTLTGISAGGGENQPLFLSVTSDNHDLVLDPIVNYTPGSSTATISFKTLDDAFGSAHLTILLMDGGLDGDLNTTGDNVTLTTGINLTVTDEPEAPVVTFSASPTISNGGRSVLLDPGVSVTDSDSSDFAGGSITVALTAGADPRDALSVASFGSGSDKVKVNSKGQLKVGKTVIGSVQGGRNGQPLVIHFDESVTSSFVELILQNVQFNGSGKNRGLRTVSVIVTDESGNESTPKSKLVAVN